MTTIESSRERAQIEQAITAQEGLRGTVDDAIIDATIATLKKALKKGGEDENLRDNLQLLEAGKKMKMKGFGDMWFQFHLEKPGAMIKKQTKAMTGRRKMVRR